MKRDAARIRAHRAAVLLSCAAVALVMGIQCTPRPSPVPLRPDPPNAPAQTKKNTAVGGAPGSMAGSAGAPMGSSPVATGSGGSSAALGEHQPNEPAAGAPAQAAARTESPRAQWRRALALYKKKDFENACPLFEAAAIAMKSNAAVWGDLGLCEYKRDNYPASIHASHLAVRFGDEAVRKAAYYNLGLASSTTQLDSEGCREIQSPAELGCKKSTFVCVKLWIQYGTGMGTDGLVAFFAKDRKPAEAAAKEFESSNYGEPQLGTDALKVYKGERCFNWCARHPEFKCVDECKDGDVLSCAVVAADACHSRVGYVCTQWDEVDGPKRMVADEFEIPEPESSGQ